MDTLEPKELLEILGVVFDSLKCAAKLNVAFGFVLKDLKDGSCRFYCPRQKITCLERSKNVATTKELTKIKKGLSNTNVIESCRRKRANTNWKLYKLMKVINFAALLKRDPMGFKDTVLPHQLLKNHSLKRLTVGENTRKLHKDNACFISALALHLHANEKIEEETPTLFNLFIE